MLLSVLSAFTCARAIGNLWSIYLGVATLFSFLENPLLLTEFLKSINDSLMCSTFLAFLAWLSSYRPFVKNDGAW